tara:strand:+ start:12764 stop:17023 length:4260 start_codon:yes stop_codon:yes gene_type:complete
MSISDKFRTWAEMETEDDFIQYLERLVSGTPSESAASTASARAPGINRPLSRLAHNTDAILDALVATKTRITAVPKDDEDDAYIDFGSTADTLVFSGTWRFLSISPIENEADNVGFTVESSIDMGDDNIVYAVIDRSSGAAPTATLQSAPGFDSLRNIMRSGSTPLTDYEIIGYSFGDSGTHKVLHLITGASIQEGERISGKGFNSMYAPAVMGRQNGAILSGGGTRSWNSGTGAVSWSSDLDLNIPSCPKLIVTDPTGLSLSPGEILTATITGRSKKALTAAGISTATQTAPAVVRDPSATSFLNSALEHDGNDYVIIAVCGGTSSNRTLHWLDGVVQTELLTSFKSGDEAGWGTTVVSVTAGDSAKAEGAALTNVHRQGNIEIEGEGVTVSSEGADGKIKVTNDYYWQDRNISFSAPHTDGGKFMVGIPGEGSGVASNQVEIKGENWIYVNVPGLTSASKTITIDLEGSGQGPRLLEGELLYFVLDRDMSASIHYNGAGSVGSVLTKTTIDAFDNSSLAKDAVVVAYRHLNNSSSSIDDLHTPVFLCGTLIEPGGSAWIGSSCSILDVSSARTYQYSHRGRMECEIVSGGSDTIKLHIEGGPIVISRPGRAGHLEVTTSGTFYSENVTAFSDSTSINKLPAVPGYALIGVTWQDGGGTTNVAVRKNFQATTDAHPTHVDDYFIPIAKLYWSSSSDYHFVLWNGAMIGEGGGLTSTTFDNETFWGSQGVTEPELLEQAGFSIPFLAGQKTAGPLGTDGAHITQVMSGFDHISTGGPNEGASGNIQSEYIFINGGMAIFGDTWVFDTDGAQIDVTDPSNYIGSPSDSNNNEKGHRISTIESLWFGINGGITGGTDTGVAHTQSDFGNWHSGGHIGATGNGSGYYAGHLWPVKGKDDSGSPTNSFNAFFGKNYLYIRPKKSDGFPKRIMDDGGKFSNEVEFKISKHPPEYTTEGAHKGQATRDFKFSQVGYQDEGVWLCVGSCYLFYSVIGGSGISGSVSYANATSRPTDWDGWWMPQTFKWTSFSPDNVRVIPFTKSGSSVRLQQPLYVSHNYLPRIDKVYQAGVRCMHPNRALNPKINEAAAADTWDSSSDASDGGRRTMIYLVQGWGQEDARVDGRGGDSAGVGLEQRPKPATGWAEGSDSQNRNGFASYNVPTGGAMSASGEMNVRDPGAVLDLYALMPNVPIGQVSITMHLGLLTEDTTLSTSTAAYGDYGNLKIKAGTGVEAFFPTAAHGIGDTPTLVKGFMDVYNIATVRRTWRDNESNYGDRVTIEFDMPMTRNGGGALFARTTKVTGVGAMPTAGTAEDKHDYWGTNFGSTAVDRVFADPGARNDGFIVNYGAGVGSGTWMGGYKVTHHPDISSTLGREWHDNQPFEAEGTWITGWTEHTSHGVWTDDQNAGADPLGRGIFNVVKIKTTEG